MYFVRCKEDVRGAPSVPEQLSVVDGNHEGRLYFSGNRPTPGLRVHSDIQNSF